MHDTALRRLETEGGPAASRRQRGVRPALPAGDPCSSGEIEGFEALVRWNHPTRGLVMPLDFVPLAEETGLIVLDRRRGCSGRPAGAGRRCSRSVPTRVRLNMAVNLSARQLQRPEIVREIARVLLDTGLAPERLVLEITESVMMQDMVLSNERLTQLKHLGVQLAVDDFGTGYSSLNYIRRFPVDILKVDKSFVDGVGDGGEESALTAAIIELAEHPQPPPGGRGHRASRSAREAPGAATASSARGTTSPSRSRSRVSTSCSARAASSPRGTRSSRRRHAVILAS